jgi:hypothetical protein
MPANQWMTDVFWAINSFRNRTLSEITLPGTHDAGCYLVEAGYGGESYNSLYSRTQAVNIAGQLAGGIRYFDIRPKKVGTNFFTWHGSYHGGQIDGGVFGTGILNQIRAFFLGLPPNSKELAIFNFSHFKDFDNGAHAALILRIQAALGNFLIQQGEGAINLYNTPYHTLVQGGPKVAILYDGAEDQGVEAYVTNNYPLPNGFFTTQKHGGANSINIFDQYTGRASLDDGYLLTGVRTDQITKLTNNSVVGGNPGHLHLFSWTCTPQPNGYPIPVAANHANPNLLPTLRNAGLWGGHAYSPVLNEKINVLYVDHFASETHNAVGSPRNGYAMPVAIADLLNRYHAGAWGGGWGVL